MSHARMGIAMNAEQHRATIELDLMSVTTTREMKSAMAKATQDQTALGSTGVKGMRWGATRRKE